MQNNFKVKNSDSYQVPQKQHPVCPIIAEQFPGLQELKMELRVVNLVMSSLKHQLCRKVVLFIQRSRHFILMTPSLRIYHRMYFNYIREGFENSKMTAMIKELL